MFNPGSRSTPVNRRIARRYTPFKDIMLGALQHRQFEMNGEEESDSEEDSNDSKVAPIAGQLIESVESIINEIETQCDAIEDVASFLPGTMFNRFISQVNGHERIDFIGLLQKNWIFESIFSKINPRDVNLSQELQKYLVIRCREMFSHCSIVISQQQGTALNQFLSTQIPHGGDLSNYVPNREIIKAGIAVIFRKNANIEVNGEGQFNPENELMRAALYETLDPLIRGPEGELAVSDNIPQLLVDKMVSFLEWVPRAQMAFQLGSELKMPWIDSDEEKSDTDYDENESEGEDSPVKETPEKLVPDKFIQSPEFVKLQRRYTGKGASTGSPILDRLIKKLTQNQLNSRPPDANLSDNQVRKQLDFTEKKPMFPESRDLELVGDGPEDERNDGEDEAKEGDGDIKTMTVAGAESTEFNSENTEEDDGDGRVTIAIPKTGAAPGPQAPVGAEDSGITFAYGASAPVSPVTAAFFERASPDQAQLQTLLERYESNRLPTIDFLITAVLFSVLVPPLSIVLIPLAITLVTVNEVEICKTNKMINVAKAEAEAEAERVGTDKDYGTIQSIT